MFGALVDEQAPTGAPSTEESEAQRALRPGAA